MDFREEWGCGETAVSVFVSIVRRNWVSAVVPCEGVDHPATRGHDTGGCEKHTHERETRRSASVPITETKVTHISKQIAPALLFVACLKIASSGPAEESMMILISPATKRRTIRKIEPVTIPMTTQPIMIRGPTTDGLGISVHVSWVFMPS